MPPDANARDWLSSFDHADPQLAPVYYDVCRDLRAAGPVRSDCHGGFWVLSRYDDVVAAERDHAVFSSAQGVTLPFFGHKVPSIPLETDPPEQATYRRFLVPWFNPRAIAGLEQSVRRIVVSVIDEFISRGHADLVRDLASPIPPAVIAILLGLPEADSHLFQDASNRMVRCSTSGDREGLALAVADLFGYLHEQVALRRGLEPSDLLGRIVNGSIEGRPLTEDEVIGMVHLIVIAGHETTVNGIGHMLARLVGDPELQEALAADRSLGPLVVDEALRYEAPVTAMARTVTQPHTLGDACLVPGDKVLLLYSAANRDEAHFADADCFVAGREPNPHLAFGIGVHRCLGEHLARMEMRIVLQEVVARLSQLRLVDGQRLEYTTGQSRGLKSLPVTFTRKH
jgi:cytochrome P450